METLSSHKTSLAKMYMSVRQHTKRICEPLKTEDYVVQPVVDVSPPKWHLGHTTWFFETFILKKFHRSYKEFDPRYNFVFNSYYESVGARVIRTDRGNLSRPTVRDVYSYRSHVDRHMQELLEDAPEECFKLLQLGLNHEQQHQELLLTDIKYILGHNPLFPEYRAEPVDHICKKNETTFVRIKSGVYDIGYQGGKFCFDNELAVHKVYLQDFEIATEPVTNGEYLQFINEGGYKNFVYWHAEGWDWIRNEKITAPLYWHQVGEKWYTYCLNGLKEIDENEILLHVSYYEAAAFAAWKHMRLPTEFEWETASGKISWGACWEWTESAYLPYPGYKKEAGAIGEYNGKFMINQMVLRGSSLATPQGHGRPTYRNFFHPHLRWQFSGIRLCKKNVPN